jgi:hypothetical protein
MPSVQSVSDSSPSLGESFYELWWDWEYLEDEDENVPIGSTQNVGVLATGGRVPEEYDPSPIQYCRSRFIVSLCTTPCDEGRILENGNARNWKWGYTRAIIELRTSSSTLTSYILGHRSTAYFSPSPPAPARWIACESSSMSAPALRASAVATKDLLQFCGRADQACQCIGGW